MIRSLTVYNYALIHELEVDFSGGLTTITGETGAGKSILIGALSLVLGSRADVMILKDKSRKCYVEAVFKTELAGVKELLASGEIECQSDILLRREIAPNGKSRSFINDTPVPLQFLREIGLLLVDIHSQHENLNLNDNIYQLEVLDAFSGNSDLLDEYSKAYDAFTAAGRELSRIRENTERVARELDFLRYQSDELEKAGLIEGEQEDLESEMELLTHAEEIRNGLYAILQAFSERDYNAESTLKEAGLVLARLKKVHPQSARLHERLESILIEIRDMTLETRQLYEKIEEDPGRAELVKERLNLIYSLQKKYHLTNTTELISFRNELLSRITELSSSEFRAESLERERNKLHQLVSGLAGELSARRENAMPAMQQKIITLLIQMGIPNARFEILNRKDPEPGTAGMDNIRFMFTANRKTDLQDISRIASGGELSRLMLSIKSLISGTRELPTIIFDEIDLGVSGEIAFKVGKILQEMSAERQVFAITHLPQVAAKGDQHFLVYKKERESGTTTEIRLLTPEERIIEIARLLSGEQTTEAAMANARELLS
jgi:DNA repair protein RecN (Recombination protein N)